MGTYFVRILIFGLLGLATLGFLAGLIAAVRFSLAGTPDKMPRFVRQVVIAVGGILATNLGAVIGVSVKQAMLTGASAMGLLLFKGADAPSVLQIGAAYFYVAGLLIALFGWWRTEFSDDPKVVVDILPQMSQTLLGVAVGVLAVALGTPKS
jgi:hypothetical protein